MSIRFNVHLDLTEELLGTSPGDPEIYKRFIESNRPDAPPADDEAAALPTLDEEIKLGTTVFPVGDDGKPFFWNYQVKGFCKDACGMLRRAEGTESAKFTAYKMVIDGLLFVEPRRIPILLPDGAEIGICERPLRAQTPQGDRVCLARAQTVPAGSRLALTVELKTDKCGKGSLVAALTEWLDYGAVRGLGQWRNSGKGTFTHTLEIQKAAEVTG